MHEPPDEAGPGAERQPMVSPLPGPVPEAPTAHVHGSVDPAAADWGKHAEAFLKAPHDAEVRRALEESAAADGAWDRLVELYRMALAHDAQLAPALRQTMARVLADKLQRPQEALVHYRALLWPQVPAERDVATGPVEGAADADSTPAWPLADAATLDAVARLLRATAANPRELAQVLEAQLAASPEAPDGPQRERRLELSELYAHRLRAPHRAVALLEQVVRGDPTAMAPLRQLVALHGAQADDAGLADALQRLLDLGSANPRGVEDGLMLAAALTRLGRVGEAIQRLRDVLEARREHPEAIASLCALAERAEQAPLFSDIFSALEPIFLAQGDHAKVAWLIERKLAHTAEVEARGGLLRRLGDIYDNRLRQKERAFATAREALALAPTDLGVRLWLEKLAGECDAHRALAEVFCQEAGRAAPEVAAGFLRRAASLYHDKLGDQMAACAPYEALLALEPGDERALAGLEAIWRAKPDLVRLAEVLERRLLSTADGARRRQLCQQLADLYEEPLASPSRAAAALQAVLAVAPPPQPMSDGHEMQDEALLQRLDGLLCRLGDFAALVACLDASIARLSDRRDAPSRARRLRCALRRAVVLDHDLHERGAAAAAFAAILAEEPQHAETLTVLQARASEGDFHAIAVLEVASASCCNWPALAAVLTQKVAATAETAARLALYLQLARLYADALRDGTLALLTLSRAYGENRGDLAVVTQLRAVADSFGLHQELVDVLSTDLDALPDPKVRREIGHVLADVLGHTLGRVDEAVACYHELLAADGRDDVTWALLDALLLKHGKWAALIDVLERRVALATRGSDKSHLLQRAADIWAERLMEPEAALRCHQQIMDVDADHPLSLKSAQKLYEQVGDWDALVQNLLRQAARCAPATAIEARTETDAAVAPERVRVHGALARVYAAELDDAVRAIEHWQEVLAADAQNAEAYAALAVLLATEERWEELARLYRAQLAHTPDPVAKRDINRHLGVVLGERLGRRDDAVASWQKVLEGDPRHVEALQALMHLHGERAEWGPFVAVARRLVPLCEAAVACDVRLALAQALGENLGEHDAAVVLSRELRGAKGCTVAQLTRLGDVMNHIEAWEEAARAWQVAAAQAPEASERVDLWARSARVWGERLKQPAAAREAWEAVLQADPVHADALIHLAQICREQQDWRRLASLLEQQLPRVAHREQPDILRELWHVQADKLAQKEAAFISGCRLLALTPADEGAAEALEALAAAANATEALCDVFADLAEQATEAAVSVALWRRLARLFATVRHDLPAAEQATERLLARAPADLEALDMLAHLAARQERYDRQVAALEAKLQHVHRSDEARAVLLEIATICERDIGAVDEALAALHRIRQFDGLSQDPEAAAFEARLYFAEGRWADLVRALQAQALHVQQPQDLLALRLRIAGLCEHELHDMDAALAGYRGALAIEPHNAAALGALERIATLTERWGELLATLQAQLVLSFGPPRCALLLKIAALYAGQLASPADAVACLERLLAPAATQEASTPSAEASEATPVQQSQARAMLEALLREQHNYERLAQVMAERAEACADPEAACATWVEVGDLWAKELGRIDRAEHAYLRAQARLAKNPGATLALARLYDRSGNWFLALDMLQRLADVFGDTPPARMVWMRMGTIHADMLGDRAAASRDFGRALAIDATYAPALMALRELAGQAEEWDTVDRLLLAAIAHTQDPERLTELLIEAGAFYRDTKHDDAAAVRFYQRALGVTVGCVAAAQALAELHDKHGRWADARDMYRVAAAEIDRHRDVGAFCQMQYRIGRTSELCGARDDAVACFRAAVEADVRYLPALEGLAQALQGQQRWEEAVGAYQTLLVHHRESLTQAELVQVHLQLGLIAQQRGQTELARRHFDHVLEADAAHAGALEALVQLDQDAGQWEAAHARMRAWADAAAPGERAAIWVAIGALTRDHLHDAASTIEALERARRLAPPTAELLGELASAYIAAQHPAPAVQVLEQATQLAGSAAERADLHVRAAAVYESPLQRPLLAVQRYSDALDANPARIDAFSSIERILAGRREWALLEVHYRAMLGRTQNASVSTRVVLWRSLAQLHWHMLHDAPSAIMAYEVIGKIDPGHAADRAALADLYAEVPARRPQAIALYHTLLDEGHDVKVALRALRHLYHAERQFDAVLIVCQALVCLGHADDDERQLADYLRRGLPVQSTGSLSEAQCATLWPAALYDPIGQLAAELYRLAAATLVGRPQTLGLKKKQALDVAHSGLLVATQVRDAAQLLGFAPIEIYRVPGSSEGLHFLGSHPPALAVGESNAVFSASATRTTLFQIGRNLAFARPELFLARALPSAALFNLLSGACAVYGADVPNGADAAATATWSTKLRRLSPEALQRLQPLARSAFPELKDGQRRRSYTAAVEQAAARAGLIAAGDLLAAAQGLRDGGDGAQAATLADRLHDLALFAVCPAHLQLRRALGLAVVER